MSNYKKILFIIITNSNEQITLLINSIISKWNYISVLNKYINAFRPFNICLPEVL